MSGDTIPVAATPEPPVVAGRRGRRLVEAAGLLRIGRIAATVLLLGAGVALGVSAFRASQPVAAPPVAGDPVTAGIDAPAVVDELASALAANDTDRIRAAVPGSPYELLTREIETWSFSDVTSVDTLSTLRDDTRTATELVVHGRNASGGPVLINLIVHVDDNLIVTFR